jgi:hypothetical protein
LQQQAVTLAASLFVPAQIGGYDGASRGGRMP